MVIPQCFPNQKLFDRFAEIRASLDEFVVAQDKAKNWLAIAAAEHEFEIARREGAPRVLLVVGPTGCGKTELCRELSRIMSVPFCRVDASEMSHTSFRGRQIGEIQRELFRDMSAKGLVNSPDNEDLLAFLADLGDQEPGEPKHDSRSGRMLIASKGVVVIDEFDKIAYVQENRATASYERHNEAVQTTLLPLFEGKSIPIEGRSQTSVFETGKLLMIAAGSFSNPEVERIIKEREGNRLSSRDGHWAFLRHEDLIRFGFLPELVGRIRAIVAIQRLREKDLCVVLRGIAVRNECRVLGYQVVFEAGVDDVLSQRAADLNLGARGVDKIYEEIKYHIYTQAEGLEVDPESGEITLTMDYIDKYWPDDI